jgi:branched-chain amino acid transport system substrate-binding protein
VRYTRKVIDYHKEVLMMKRVGLGYLIAVFLVLFCQNGWAAETVKYGLGLPLTGPVAFLGNEYLKGAQTAVDEINKAGGILGGRKLELIVRDHKGIPSEAVTVAKRLVTEDKVALFSADLPSSATIAAQVVSKANKAVQIGSYAFAPDVTDKGHPYHFRVCTRAEEIAKALGQHLAGLPKSGKIAMVAPNDDYGRGDLGSLIAVFKKIGKPEVVYEGYYERNQTDFNTMLLKIKSLDPDIYYVNVRWPASATTLQQMDDLGMIKGKQLSSSVNFYNREMVQRVGPLMAGVIIGVTWAPMFPDPESQRFLKAYKAKFKDEPNDSAAQGWTPIMIGAMALDKAGTDKDQEKIRTTLRANKWPSPQGLVSFDDRNDSGVPGYVLTFRNGEYQLLK